MRATRRVVLFAAIASCIPLCIVSCDKGLSPNEQQKQKKEKASRFWEVVGQLVSPFDITTDYEGKYFEPTLGTPSPADPLTRIVSTNSLRAAVDRFNNLTGADITTSTSTHTWNNKDVGSLTWNKTTDGSSWATVDVNIPQVPRLRRIVYQSKEQGNENGSFDGKAYYLVVMLDREHGGKETFFDLQWNKQNFTFHFRPYEHEIPKPERLQELIDISEKLSRGFPHVRVDMYCLNDGSFRFGEMTFSSFMGLCTWDPPEMDMFFGKFLNLPEKYQKINIED